MLHHFHHQLLRIPPLGFRLWESNFPHGLGTLASELTINGVTVSPTMIYKGKDASTSQWLADTFGNTLSKVEGGTNFTTGNDTPFLNTIDKAVQFNAGDYFQAAGAVFGDVTTEDMVIEVVSAPLAGGSARTFGKFAAALGTGAGWGYVPTATLVRFSISDGSTTITTSGAATVAGELNHTMLFIDHSGSTVSYTNAQRSGAPSTTPSGSFTNAGSFTVGANPNGSSPGSDKILHIAMWKRNDWLDSHIQDALVLDRFNRLMGIRPTKAVGTKSPLAQTRATTSYIDKQDDTTGIRSLFLVGPSWMRLVSRKESGTSLVRGYLSEQANTNLCLQSESLGITWALLDAGDTLASAWGLTTTSPANQLNGADGIVADSTDGPHGVTQAITLTAAAYTFAVWAKKGNQNWLYMSDNTVAGATAYFDLNNGRVGTVGTAATSMIQDWGNGWYRCELRYTGTVAAHTHQISPIAADNGVGFAGDGVAVNTYIWGAQVELNTTGYCSSYIPTTTATATRNADLLYYRGDDGNLGGIGSNKKFTTKLDILFPNLNNLATSVIFTLNDGGSANDRILIQLLSTDVIEYISTAGGSVVINTDGVIDASDGILHRLNVSGAIGRAETYMDGRLQGTVQTPADLADDLDRITIGVSSNDLNQPYGLISNFKLYTRAFR